jgi:hypothetical protein
MCRTSGGCTSDTELWCRPTVAAFISYIVHHTALHHALLHCYGSSIAALLMGQAQATPPTGMVGIHLLQTADAMLLHMVCICHTTSGDWQPGAHCSACMPAALSCRCIVGCPTPCLLGAASGGTDKSSLGVDRYYFVKGYKHGILLVKQF